MKVEGERQFKISKEELWKLLMDPVVLAKITPGVAELEQVDSDSYKTISKIKIGPVGGEFKGDLSVVEKSEPDSFVIKMKQLSKIGNADVSVNLNLADTDEGGAQLSFDGKANLSGVIARTGQRVLSGVANTITREVFESLEQHIEENKSSVSETNSDFSTETTTSDESTGIFSNILKWFKNLFS